MDRYRITERLKVYGLQEVGVSQDGNCQFRAISDQLFNSPEFHKRVRKAVVKQLKNNRRLYECYIPMKYKSYCQKMSKSGEWGDHVTLQAAADKFDAKIILLTSYEDLSFIDVIPLNNQPTRELRLSFWSEAQHYNSIRDAPLPRKKNWLIGCFCS